MQQLVQARLRATKDGKVPRLDPAGLSAREVTAMAQAAMKLERQGLVLCSGSATDKMKAAWLRIVADSLTGATLWTRTTNREIAQRG